MVISNKKLSVEKINETQIIKLLSSDNIEQENKDNLLTRILKIEEKIWIKKENKNGYKKNSRRVLLWVLLIFSICLFCSAVFNLRVSPLNSIFRPLNSIISVLNNSLVRYVLAFSLLAVFEIIALFAPEDTFEHVALFNLFSIAMRYMGTALLIMLALMLLVTYISGNLIGGLVLTAIYATGVGALLLIQNVPWLYPPVMPYSKYVNPKKIEIISIWLVIIFFSALLKYIAKSNDNYYFFITLICCVISTLANYVFSSCWSGVSIQDIIKGSDKIILNLSCNVAINLKILIGDSIDFDLLLSEDSHRLLNKHVLASDELRVLLLLYTGHIVSANPIFESKSRKVVVPSSLLLSEHINELLCSMSDTAYVDTSKKMICILNKKQKECKEDLLEFLLALRKHLNEEYSR